MQQLVMIHDKATLFHRSSTTLPCSPFRNLINVKSRHDQRWKLAGTNGLKISRAQPERQNGAQPAVAPNSLGAMKGPYIPRLEPPAKMLLQAWYVSCCGPKRGSQMVTTCLEEVSWVLSIEVSTAQDQFQFSLCHAHPAVPFPRDVAS